MGKSPAFQFYAQDFLMGTTSMTAEEVGGYIRLLCVQWDTGFVPNDMKKLKHITGCNRNAIASILEKFSLEKDGNFRNKRLEEVRQKKQEYSQQQKANAERRWGNQDADPHAMALPTDMPNESQTDALLTSSSNTTLPKGKDSIDKSVFLKPELQEVTAYFLSKNGTAKQAENYFLDRESKDWTYGKGVKLKKWKADASKWLLNGWGLDKITEAANRIANQTGRTIF